MSKARWLGAVLSALCWPVSSNPGLLRNHHGQFFSLLSLEQSGVRSWDAARQACESQGSTDGRIASPLMREEIAEQLRWDLQEWRDLKGLGGQVSVLIGLEKPAGADWRWTDGQMADMDFDDSSLTLWFDESSPDSFAELAPVPADDAEEWVGFLNLTQVLSEGVPSLVNDSDYLGYSWHWSNESDFFSDESWNHSYVLCEMPWEWQVTDDYETVLVSQFTKQEFDDYNRSENKQFDFEPLPWATASRYCEDTFGTSLGSLHSDFAHASSLIRDERGHTWIGLNERDRKGVVLNEDGSRVVYSQMHSRHSNWFDRCYTVTKNHPEWVAFECNDTSVHTYEFFCNLQSDEWMRTEYPLPDPSAAVTVDDSDNSVLVSCDTVNSCEQGLLSFSDRTSVSVFCEDTYSCDSLTLDLDNVQKFLIESRADTAGFGLTVDIENVTDVDINANGERYTFSRAHWTVEHIHGSFSMHCAGVDSCLSSQTNLAGSTLIGTVNDSNTGGNQNGQSNLNVYCSENACRYSTFDVYGPFASKNGRDLLDMKVECDGDFACQYASWRFYGGSTDQSVDNALVPEGIELTDTIGNLTLICTNRTLSTSLKTCEFTDLSNEDAVLGDVNVVLFHRSSFWSNIDRLASDAEWNFGQVSGNFEFRCESEYGALIDSLISIESGNNIGIRSLGQGCLHSSEFNIQGSGTVTVECEFFDSCEYSTMNIREFDQVDFFANVANSLRSAEITLTNITGEIRVHSPINQNPFTRSEWTVTNASRFVAGYSMIDTTLNFRQVAHVEIDADGSFPFWPRLQITWHFDPLAAVPPGVLYKDPTFTLTSSSRNTQRINIDASIGDDGRTTNRVANQDWTEMNIQFRIVNKDQGYAQLSSFNLDVDQTYNGLLDGSSINVDYSMVCNKTDFCNGVDWKVDMNADDTDEEAETVAFLKSEFHCVESKCADLVFQVDGSREGQIARVDCAGPEACTSARIRTAFAQEYSEKHPSEFGLSCQGQWTCSNMSISSTGRPQTVDVRCIGDDKFQPACSSEIEWPLTGQDVTILCARQGGCSLSDFSVNGRCLDGSLEVRIDGFDQEFEMSGLTILCPDGSKSKPNCVLRALRKGRASDSQIISTLKQWDKRRIEIYGSDSAFSGGLSSGLYSRSRDSGQSCSDIGMADFNLDCRTQSNSDGQWFEGEGCSSLVLSIYDPASISIVALTCFFGCFFLILAHKSMAQYNPQQYRVQFGLEVAMLSFLVSCLFFLISTFPMLAVRDCKLAEGEADAGENCRHLKLGHSSVFRAAAVMALVFFVAFLNFLEIQAFNTGMFLVSWKYFCSTTGGLYDGKRAKKVASPKGRTVTLEDLSATPKGFSFPVTEAPIESGASRKVSEMKQRFESNADESGGLATPEPAAVKERALSQVSLQKIRARTETSSMSMAMSIHERSSQRRLIVEESIGWTPRKNWIVQWTGEEAFRRLYLTMSREFFDLNDEAGKEDGLVFMPPFPLPMMGTLDRRDGFDLTEDELKLLLWKRQSVSVLIAGKIAFQIMTAMMSVGGTPPSEYYTPRWTGRLFFGFCWMDMLVLSNTHVSLAGLLTLLIWLCFSRFSPWSNGFDNLQSQSLFEETITSKKSRHWCDVAVLCLVFAAAAMIVSVKGRAKQIRAYKLFVQFLDFSTDLIVIVYWGLSGSFVWMSILLWFVVQSILIQYLKVFDLLDLNTEGYWSHLFILVGMARGWAGVKLWNQGESNGSDVRWYRISARVEMIETCYESYPSLLFGLYLLISDPRASLSGPLVVSVLITVMAVAIKIVLSSHQHIFLKSLLDFAWLQPGKSQWISTLVFSLFAFTDFFVRSVSLAFLMAAMEGFNGNIQVGPLFMLSISLLLIGLFAFEAGLIYYAALDRSNLSREDIQFIIEYCMPNSLSVTPMIFAVFAVYPFHRHCDWMRVLHCQYFHIAVALLFYLLVIFWRDTLQLYPNLLPLCITMVCINLLLTLLLQYRFVDRTFEKLGDRSQRKATVFKRDQNEDSQGWALRKCVSDLCG